MEGKREDHGEKSGECAVLDKSPPAEVPALCADELKKSVHAEDR